MTAAKATVHKKATAAKTETEQVQDKPGLVSVKDFGPPVGTYPVGAELFSYTPSSGKGDIWFPLEITQPDPVWLWEMYDKPFHVQSWEWMKLADIPKSMQRKAVELLRDAPDEYLELFNKWFAAMGGATAGE